MKASNSFSMLSLKDLLEARDLYHVHLVHKENVVATAVGRYLVRHGDKTSKGVPTVQASGAKPKAPRTLQNSAVREFSWPCILVFVNEWLDPDDFRGERAADMIPKRLYMPDGKVVPVCVVLASPDERAQPTPTNQRWPSDYIGGGYPLLVEVQGEEHVASIGCLMTDGHTVYALTNRHVAGREGERIFSKIGHERVEVGVTSDIQLGKVPFEAAYPGFKGQNVRLNMDVGLIEVHDKSAWTAQIFNLGIMGEMDDFGVDNLSLDLIGESVIAYGSSSGIMKGQIQALFYRYKSVAGTEFVTDFLIGPRRGKELVTQPGDSGTVWMRETRGGRRPLCIQWGAHVYLSSGTSQTRPYALASSLCKVCEILDLDIVRDWSIGLPDRWGAVGHFTIAARAIAAINDPKLKAFMQANLKNLSYTDDELKQLAKKKKKPVRDIEPLADVPDNVWKKNAGTRTDGSFNGGRDDGGNKPENPNHFADIDVTDSHGKTMLDICRNAPQNVTPKRWIEYYQDPAVNQSLKGAGLLPFRVWQFFDAMVDFAKNGKDAEFLCAAGILAHYIGDACQPLHCSQFHHGDPAETIEVVDDGKKKKVALAFGVHSDYETKMVDRHTAEILEGISTAPKVNPPTVKITSGHTAAVASVELMQRTFDIISPTELVEVYSVERRKGVKANSVGIAESLWSVFGERTIASMAQGGQFLAALWDAAWKQGSLSSTQEIDARELKALYLNPDFLPSKTIGEIEPLLKDVPKPA